MSKYNKFEDFMQEVINVADSKCHRQYHKSLAEAYDVDMSITNMIKAIIGHGWWIFAAIVGLLVLGPIAFGTTLIAFVHTPPGIIAVGVLAIFGGVAAIRTMYKNKVLPIAVRDTGKKYKEEYYKHIGDNTYIDRLVDSASDYLLSKATILLR